MNPKFISKSNRVLRKVLQKEKNIDILQDFIETFLEISIEKIKINPYLKNKEKYLPQEENFGIADMRIYFNNNQQLNVGIQWIDGYYVQSKMLLYYAQIHTNQLEYEEYDVISKTITINLLDFKYFNSADYHKKIKIVENTQDETICETIEMHILELPKFKKKPQEPMTKKYAWMSYLKGSPIQTIPQVFEKIRKLDEQLEEFWEKEKIE